MLRRLAAVLAAFTIYVAMPLVTTSAQQPAGALADGEVLVKYRPTTSAARRNGIAAGRSAALLRRFSALDVDHLRLPPGQSVADAVAALRSTPDVVLAQPNYIRRAIASSPPNDPWWLVGFMWGMERIQAQPAWDSMTTGDPSVVVADIDTGVDYTHPDLAANMWRNPGETADNGLDDDGNGYVDDIFGIDTVNNDTDPMDDQGHGTHTSGTIGARGNNGVGVVGVAWQTSILACKFLDAQGSGTDADAVECFDYLLVMKQRGINIRVSNNSWGAARQDPPATVLKDAIDAAGAAGIVNVFSAGNAGTNNDVSPMDPASFDSPSIITVAASDESDGRASFSNYGQTSVDLAAPGSSILSTLQGSYAFASGTSMAAPHVAGAAALMAARNPALSVASIKTLLMQNADVLPQWAGLTASSGRLNLLNALTAAGGNNLPSVSVTSPAPGSSLPRSVAVVLEAMATDSDGTIAQVQFFANGIAVGSDSTGPNPYSVGWVPAQEGTYALTAVATDDDGAVRASAPVTVTVAPPAGRVNAALASYGAVATASSTFNANYPTSSAINGDRRGLNWGSGGGWNDGTRYGWPDWLEVQFNGAQTIEEIDVFTLQDSYGSPVQPTNATTFTKYGIVDFSVEYWTGSAWQVVPGGAVTGNNLVWRQFTFAPVTTSRIRVLVTNGLSAHSRITEVEAYTAPGSFNNPPNVSVTSPAGGATFDVGTPVALAATASDSDGTVTGVNFFANGAQLGAGVPNSGVYTFQWLPAMPGTYTLTAIATDNGGTTRTSAPVNVTVTPPAGRVNVALAAYGAVATASSTYGAGYPASSVINGDRRGLNWTSGGGWNDGTRGVWPDWLEVQFDGTQAIEEIDIFTLQDSYGSPVEPTATTTFTKYGVVDFTVESWTGSTWEIVPGGTVTANNLVWRRFSFPAINTSRIRVRVTNGLGSHARLTEVEAYSVPGTFNLPPTVSLTGPVSGSAHTVPGTVPLAATANDTDGFVTKVDFYANGTKVGSSTSPNGNLYTFDWAVGAPGTYSLIAVAIDDGGKATTSAPVNILVSSLSGRVNVALASSGSTATASSTRSSGFTAAGVINGDRKGLNWGSGGGWHDDTASVWPDWIEVQFSAPKTIDEVDVFSVQDSYTSPSAPTYNMAATKYGLQDFTVEFWTGTAWQVVNGGTVIENTKVWRQFYFAPVTTSRIRIHVTRAMSSYSRMVELEAWGEP
jgi:subtilisin family serine protease